DWKYWLGLCFIPALFLFGLWRHHQVANFSRYTIAFTTKRVSTLKLGPEIEYVYYVKGIKYRNYGYDVEKFKIVYPDGRYLVKYSFENPNYCEIQWEFRIPYSLRFV